MANNFQSHKESASYPTGPFEGSCLNNTLSRNRRGSMGSSTESPIRSRRMSASIHSPPSPTQTTLPLSATASINASMREGSPGPNSRARRKSVITDLALADDSLPPPAEIATANRKPSLELNKGTGRGSLGGSHGSLGNSPMLSGMGDPHHRRAPSIGEVHQQMEQEQEAQVNRLLLQIQQQQLQIEALKRQNSSTSTSSSAIATTPGVEPPVQPSSFLGPMQTSELFSFVPPPTPQRGHSSSSANTTVASTMPAGKPSPPVSPSPSNPQRVGSSMSISMPPRSGSRGSSRPTSPNIRSGARSGILEQDEAKYWQAEAMSITRENEMLKQRVKELERQLKSVKRGSGVSGSGSTVEDIPVESNAPIRSSSLARESMNVND